MPDSSAAAGHVIQQLAEGRLSAASPAVAEVREQLLTELRGHSQPRQARAIDQLSELYDKLPSRADRWELAGKIVSSGPAGVPLLEGPIKKDVPFDLTAIVKLPLDQQLSALVSFMASLLPAMPRGDHAPRPPEHTPPERPPMIRRDLDRRKEDENDDPPGNLEDILADDTQSPPARLAAARKLGPLAVAVLEEMATKSNVSREVAIRALRELSVTDARPAVLHALAHLAARDRAFAEYVRAQISSVEREAKDPRAAWARSSQHAAMPDGWLRDAIKRGDAPGIMQAGIDRPALAIPLIMRHCADLAAAARD